MFLVQSVVKKSIFHQVPSDYFWNIFALNINMKSNFMSVIQTNKQT
jgi:hypothetical protein